MRETRFVVLGSSGFVGGALLTYFKNLNLKVLKIARKEINFQEITSIEQLRLLIHPSDVIVFAIADVPVKNLVQFENNLIQVRNFIAGIENLDYSHVIYISSDAVYSDSPNAISETSNKSPENLHGLMHLVRETILRDSVSNQKLTIVRPTIIYGASDTHNSYGPCSFIRKVSMNLPIELFGDGAERRDFIHISDVVRYIHGLASKRIPGEFNLVTGELTSFKEIARMVVEISGTDLPILSKPRSGSMPHNGYRPFDNTKLRVLFPEIIPICINEGLKLEFNEY
jgi:UDP-glucose 4-epimerase